jgi:hypothetical protein
MAFAQLTIVLSYLASRLLYFFLISNSSRNSVVPLQVAPVSRRPDRAIPNNNRWKTSQQKLQYSGIPVPFTNVISSTLISRLVLRLRDPNLVSTSKSQPSTEIYRPSISTVVSVDTIPDEDGL